MGVIKPVLVGLKVTLKNLFRKKVTLQYPDEKSERSDRWRGIHRLRFDEETGKPRCVACGLCAAVCPAKAIRVVASEDEKGVRYPKEFVVDLLRCIFCGFCQEVCPKGAIYLSKEYELTGYSREELVWDMDRLLEGGQNAG